ncbi:MAG: hypothetical protein HC939_09245 [Pleurocapsa sp. SU_5_0]|nr:hypothetical protein [Pleurocapsa sp. SU_5_0]NJO96295.1 hypothetical protein [Pleurocapsa sp. CRU_1_2]NJR45463.1 hypothetical protein [Hyellaceae cyanobacterium CSU_1_1]
MTNLSDEPLQGQALLQMITEVCRLPRNEQAIRCGYHTIKTLEDGQSFKEANLREFYDAVLTAKGVFKEDVNSQTVQSNKNLQLPLELEPYREKLEATVKPYIKIQTQLTQKATWWQN